MQLHLTGRHLEITPALEQYTRERLEKLQKLLPAILEAHVILHVEKHRHQAEINLHTRRFSLSGAHESHDMYASLSSVFEKLEHQARKRKEQRTGRKRRTVAARTTGETEPRPARLPGSDAQLGAGPRLVRTELPDLKPMSVEDAVLQIQESNREFVVFRNAQSHRVNVVYVRHDGHFGVIET
jgi:putative sigma-54 modulation protein